MIPHKAKLKASLSTVDTRFAVRPDKNNVIKWHVAEESFTKDIDKYKQILAFEKGFKILAPCFYPISFDSTSDRKEAPIEMFFKHPRDKSLPEKFDKGVLAYAYLPQGNPLGIESNIYFNDEVTWSSIHKKDKFSLLKVFIHEVLHALGLQHSSIKEDIMYPSYQPNNDIVISQDTKDSIRRLYERFKMPTSVKRGILRDKERVS